MEFVYKAKTKEGETVKGIIEALNEKAALDILMEKGLIVLSLVEKGKKGLTMEIRLPFISRISQKEKVFLSRQLAVMVSAGLPLVKALEILTEQTTNKILKSALREITRMVREGTRFSTALAKYPNIFSEFYINMVRTAETAGKLDEILNYLADEEEKNYDLMSKVKGAMVYPIFVLIATFVIIFLMMSFVIPKIVVILKESEVALPLPTLILISLANFFSKQWFKVLISLIGIILFFQIFKRTIFGKYLWDFLKLKMPIFGELFLKIYLVRFTRSFSTLLIGGLPLNEALKIVAEVVGNFIFKDLILKTKKAVEDGYSVSSVFSKSKIIPPMLSQVMFVGEQTGQLDSVLEKMGKFYAREVENTLNRLTTLLEPVIIIFLGFIVGGMVAAILMPMYNLASAIK